MPPAGAGFRLGIYVFEDAKVLDFTAPYGGFRAPGTRLASKRGARIMEYGDAYALYRDDLEGARPSQEGSSDGRHAA